LPAAKQNDFSHELKGYATADRAKHQEKAAGGHLCRNPACIAVQVSLRRCGAVFGLGLALLFSTASAVAQDLGHKLPGLLGLDAGRIPEPGLYLVDRLAIYEAEKLRDRNGSLIPTAPFNLLGRSNAFGVSYTRKMSGDSIFLTMTAGGPIAQIKLNNENRFEIGVDRLGLGDPYIQPFRLGWRKKIFDVVTSYSIYLPTGRSPLAGGKGVSSGQITQEFSGGGSIYFRDRTRFVTAIASYQLNSRQRGIDIRRGDPVQVQGGIGTKFFRQLAETGVAGYALWQVRNDRGTELPPALTGIRDRVYGLGPEGAMLIKAIQAQVRVRYLWDFGVHARPQGHIFVTGINFLVHRP
jgi:hypothetical protein